MAPGFQCLVEWAQRKLEGSEGTFAPQWPRIWRLINERDAVHREQLHDGEWEQLQAAASQYARGNVELCEEMRPGRGMAVGDDPASE